MIAIAVAASSMLYSCGISTTKANETKDEKNKAEMIQRGEYLVTIGGCNDCHTPMKMGPNGPEPDAERRLSGHRDDLPRPVFDSSNFRKGWVGFSMQGTAMAFPFGMVYAANITSDATGIGNWTLEQFKTAMTRGKYKGLENGRDLLPPMPWQNYAKMTDDDIEAIFHYLQSTKPVRNMVPAPGA